ncbi:hypothetical protein F511_36380 [Dorcoceras hygrometricum]|uniref:Uncharacterized protein n=1 Tax=Dorcoceras hygrometricum TaxID=472368 RepID=A0A2Z7DAA0_9LAMI|nr:hypothetical protein F511_36380 [Dorcoceras hygrometricum]
MQNTVACDWIHYSLRLLTADYDGITADVIIADPLLRFLSTADCDDITADVIIAAHSFLQYADVIIADSRSYPSILNLLIAFITIRGPRLLRGTSSSPTSTSPRRHLNNAQGAAFEQEWKCEKLFVRSFLVKPVPCISPASVSPLVSFSCDSSSESPAGRNSAVVGARVKRRRFMEPAAAR